MLDTWQDNAFANLHSLDQLLRWAAKRSGARAVAGQVPCQAAAVILYYLR